MSKKPKQKLTTFTVCELQEETRWRKWQFEVEAATAEEAIELVRQGDGGDPCDCDIMGEPDYGPSTFAVVENGDEEAAWEKCGQDFARA